MCIRDRTITTHGYGLTNSKYSHSNARNYLLLNKLTKEKTWIWEHNDFLLSRKVRVYTHTKYRKVSDEVLGFAFEQIEKDTNKDKKITSEDNINLTYLALSSQKLFVIDSDIDSIEEIKQTSDESIHFFYRKKGKLLFKVYNKDLTEVLSQDEIAPIGEHKGKV